MKKWVCSVCGFEFDGEKPPRECPQCSSSWKEFDLLKGTPGEKLAYEGKKFDVLLINGSSHRSHNTSALCDVAENELNKRKVSYRRFNLNELEIRHCWCCYSMADSACTYPCRDQLDDMPALHEMIVDSKAVIIFSPINWNNMSARLKDFLDRLTCIQNLCLLKKEPLTIGKIVGIAIDGHEDGALKTAMDIFVYFQQMGYVMAPFGFAYRTHGSAHKAESDNRFFVGDEKTEKDIRGLVDNVVETMNLGLEDKLKKKIVCVSE
jgi:multimeric flavodoxin WrbA/rubredoxin